MRGRREEKRGERWEWKREGRWIGRGGGMERRGSNWMGGGEWEERSGGVERGGAGGWGH